MSAEKVVPINDEVKETLRVEEVQLDENLQPVELRIVEHTQEQDKNHIPYDVNELANFDTLMEEAYDKNIQLQLSEASIRQENERLRDEIWGLKKEVSGNDWELGELERQLELRNKALAVGGGIAGAISIAAILGYVKERKVHRQIVALIEETALILANEEVESRFVSFDELVLQVSIRLSEFEVRSFRRPFGIPAKELERTTSLLVGMLRTAETLGMQYVNFETANTVDVEPKE